MSTSLRPTGEIAATVIAVWIGLLAMGMSHIWSVINPLVANSLLLKVGSWMPGWYGIGPFAGKETIGLLTWLLTWSVLGIWLRRRYISLKPIFYLSLFSFCLLLLLYWPPFYHAIWGWLPTMPGS